jgi:hypothetical protein
MKAKIIFFILITILGISYLLILFKTSNQNNNQGNIDNDNDNIKKIWRIAGANKVNDNDNKNLNTINNLAPKGKFTTLTPENIFRDNEDYDKNLLKDPTKEGKCEDPNFPYLNKQINKCVQCFPSSFNCLTGWQTCRGGMCVQKRSPQCRYYPTPLINP